ncbi:MAG: PhnD/SsuA/transferrin family substrate-binding protein [Acidobacteria bacterium]|nr:PhnD/SsuA/transferrin family substrate-binding protein [Acidobacteriota bacterium]
MSHAGALLLGAVAYDPKVVAIWDGFREYFAERGLDFDYVLYSNYERQVASHLAGHIHVAWNSPLAWLQTEAAAAKLGRRAEAICMRDTDRDLRSVILVQQGSPIHEVGELAGMRVGVGAKDSPQGYLLPLDLLAQSGLNVGRDLSVVPFDVLLGKHGDHIGGERLAVEALTRGEVDAACILDGNYLAFAQAGLLPSGSARVLARTALYDHCNFTVLDDAPAEQVARFRELLLEMSYADPKIRPLLDMEGLKQWLPGRTEGYLPLAAAVERFGALQPFLAELGL